MRVLRHPTTQLRRWWSPAPAAATASPTIRLPPCAELHAHGAAPTAGTASPRSIIGAAPVPASTSPPNPKPQCKRRSPPAPSSMIVAPQQGSICPVPRAQSNQIRRDSPAPSSSAIAAWRCGAVFAAQTATAGGTPPPYPPRARCPGHHAAPSRYAPAAVPSPRIWPAPDRHRGRNASSPADNGATARAKAPEERSALLA